MTVQPPSRCRCIHVSADADVLASPREVLELVLDLSAYQRIDPKIREVRALPQMDGVDFGVAEVVGSLWRFPPLADTHLVELARWSSVTFTGAPRVLARRVYQFTGRFETTEVAGFTRVRHSYDVAFQPRLLRALTSRVSDWMVHDLQEELSRLGAMLGSVREGTARATAHPLTMADRPWG